MAPDSQTTHHAGLPAFISPRHAGNGEPILKAFPLRLEGFAPMLTQWPGISPPTYIDELRVIAHLPASAVLTGSGVSKLRTAIFTSAQPNQRTASHEQVRGSMERLTDFIHGNMNQIIAEWETFARSLPPGSHMTREMLRDHVRGILTFIAKDIATSQSDSQQAKKSQGDGESTPGADTSAEIHGVLRLESGFDIMEMVSEYRALRASVTKLWTRGSHQISETELLDLIRFNEAIDQALAESVFSFTKHLDGSKDLLLGILGHDVRNPLGVILMSAQLLKIKGPLNERQSVLTTQIESSVGRINEMVNVLLDLARARLGPGIPIQKQEMNFGSVAQTIVEDMRVLHPARKFVIEVQGNVTGQGDPARIKQVLSNLAGNAVQYGLEDGPITVSAVAVAQNIELSVHNMGKPIPASVLPTIFDALVRGPGSDTTGSTNLGLGLYIAKMIAVAHGGDLSVVSTGAEGTTFTARFPR